MSLGDLFPQHLKKELASHNLKIGAVLRFFVPDTKPPKIKYLAIVGIDNEQYLLATIFINSEVNINVLNSPELRALQLLLAKQHCTFLDHDSYADCSKVQERNLTEIHDKLTETPGTHVGELNSLLLQEAIALLKGAKSISPKIKKKYGLL